MSRSVSRDVRVRPAAESCSRYSSFCLDFALASLRDAISCVRSVASSLPEWFSRISSSSRTKPRRKDSSRSAYRTDSRSRICCPRMRNSFLIADSSWRSSSSCLAILLLSSLSCSTSSVSRLFSMERTWIIWACFSTLSPASFRSSIACSWAFSILLYFFFHMSLSSSRRRFSSSNCRVVSRSSSVLATKAVSRSRTRASSTRRASRCRAVCARWVSKDQPTTVSSKYFRRMVFTWLSTVFCR
mmetsp:Transcript_47142/g.139224  ORF Transcript_47142/g.139224 Transcript_47142/m.139224 type:complete len:243 (+) Transcript_47142:371-1099(+)